MPRTLIAAISLALLGIGAACSSKSEPVVSPEAYREAVTAFYTGLSAMQTTQEVLARTNFDRVTTLVPQEPAGWADLGLLLLRQQEIDQGAERLAHAAALAPESGAIQRLQALAESRRGNLAEAITHWQRALELDPKDYESAYALALDTERQGGPSSDEAAQRILGGLLATHENLAARLEYVRVAAKRGDQAALAPALTALDAASASWSPDAQDQLKQVAAAAAANPKSAATRVAFLKNYLLRETAYRLALAELTTPREEVGRPLTRFLRLKNPEPQPAPPDTAIAFTVTPLGDAQAQSWASPAWLTGEGDPVIASAGPKGIRLSSLPASVGCSALGSSDVWSPDAVAPADLNYDYRVDLAVAGPGGVCLLRQDEHGRFADVTRASKLPTAAVGTPAYGIWPADVDTDGDLDLVVAPREGSPTVLRNNGDGTFDVRPLFTGVSSVRGFVWADLDGEGVPDAAFVDAAGAVHVFLNQRAGILREDRVPAPHGPVVALAPLDDNGDGIFDLVVLASDGTVSRLARSESGGWDTSVVGKVDPPQGLAPGAARLIAADLDNNGGTDLIVCGPSSSRVLLAGPAHAWTPLAAPIDLGVQAAADLDGDGRIDLIGLIAGGRPARAGSHGTKAYHWQVFRTRSTTVTGDQRINSFGIGGEIEMRSGIHSQKQVIASPVVHFGLGEATGAEVVRITWPNGALQSEFDTKADETVKATQRLKGSCPWLFAWNGREMGFVTDLLWRSPLGLRINAQATANVAMTEDWVKIAGSQLAPRDGAYDIRITAELWETHFFDLVSLVAVDHPEGTEVFVDERFAVPPPEQQIIATGPVARFASVRDDRGGDVSELAQSRDSRYVDTFGRGPYQGITRTHFVEMELPEAAPRSGPLWLVGQGWIHPTDSSINVAISQGTHPAPEGLSLQVAGPDGRFRQVRAGLGFPSGKDKTVMIDLAGLFGPAGPRRLRLSTNLEIFWDRLGWARGQPDVRLQTQRLPLAGAELAYRGYSVTEQASASVPERPRYVLAGTGQRWRDLEGYYTRFGEVGELLQKTDDRYVIMNAGDELRVRFPAAPAPATGLVRDFVLISDGWEKDGDYNTRFSRTVLPLPAHANSRYDTPPGRLEDDPVYRAHPGDFATYHTRYVTPDALREALILRPDVNQQ